MFENCIEKKAADVKVGDTVCSILGSRLAKYVVRSVGMNSNGTIRIRTACLLSGSFMPEELVYVEKKITGENYETCN